MQETGVQVKDTPKIKMDEPDEDKHVIISWDQTSNPTPTMGHLLVFRRKPTIEELKGAEEI